MNKKNCKNYYIGLDIGTNSVGWAVTDTEYNILNFNGKAMWGAHLFEEASSAADRRQNRCARRALARKKERLLLLEEIFSDEIEKVDPNFFIRIKDSFFVKEDKTNKDDLNTLFNDKNYKDKDYHYAYPTIYHLRKELYESEAPHDIRLVYLALHHIIKHRGHFLYEGNFTNVSEIQIDNIISDLVAVMNDEIGVDIEVDKDTIKNVVSNQRINITEKKKELEKGIQFSKEDKKQVQELIKALSGAQFSITALFDDDELKENDKDIKISFSKSDFDEKEETLRTILGDKFELISALKRIYDWGILTFVLAGENSISEAKVKLYDEHKTDLIKLKKLVKTYCPEKYYMVFGKPGDKLNNYSRYIGSYSTRGKNTTKSGSIKKCTKDEFYDFLKKNIFAEVDFNGDITYSDIMEKIDLGIFLNKPKSKDNSVLPYQINKFELVKSLDNASNYLHFLNEKDENGYKNKDKILSLMTFRIPYYVGPLNTVKNKNAWAVRKSEGKIYPWNFNEKIDIEKSAEKFILRMTNNCTYLVGEDVLPKDSILYSKYRVLNEINNLKIDDVKISNELKQDIYRELFLRNRKVTINKLIEYLIVSGVLENNKEAKSRISGLDETIINNMSSYLDFLEIFDKSILTIEEEDVADDIIRNIVLFGDDKKLLRKRLEKKYGGKLSEKQIKLCCDKKYSGWGRLSEKLLRGITAVNDKTGEVLSIIDMMLIAEGNPNLMQLLSNDYPYMKMINEINSEILISDNLKDNIDNLYVSAPVKRSIYRTAKIVKEIVSIMGFDPDKIFIEMARGSDGSGRTKSRRQQLLALYKNCKKDVPELFNDLEKEDEGRLRREKLFLYYLQMGKSMYTGKSIDLDNLDAYDIDHIFPQSKVKDDSLDNRVLVEKELNGKKGDAYPINSVFPDMQTKMGAFWRMLYHLKFMSKTKYDRLTRTTGFTEGELVGFVGRQLVETRQSTKAVAQILDSMCPDSEIVYVKARNVSEFRRGVDDIKGSYKTYNQNKVKESNKFIKCRDLNDFHHAKDAYLNIVVGNVFNTKFTKDPRRFFAEKNPKYSFNAMYKFDVKRNDYVAWIPSSYSEGGTLQLGTMGTIRKYMHRNNVLVTRMKFKQSGALFDVTLMPKGTGQVPQKSHGNRSNIGLYGGYNKAKGSHMFIVEHTLKGERVVSMEPVLIYQAEDLKDNADLEKYCINELKYENPVIIKNIVLYNTLFDVEGFRMEVTGRTGSLYVMRNAEQLILDEDSVQYLKRISKFIERRKSDKNRMITAFDDIDKATNELLYETYLQKLQMTPYIIRFENIKDIMMKNRSVFELLSLEEQAEVLFEINKLLKCNRELSDLTKINGVKSSGILRINKKLSSAKSITIVEQSITGLFEKRQRIK